MKTPICRTCGCSLVRLGIPESAATLHEHHGHTHPFCCPGCVEVFETNPERFLKETSDLIVCPTCLAEKPVALATAVNIAGQDVYFCHCPACVDLFKANPGVYLGRLDGSIPSAGVHDHNGCCLSPVTDDDPPAKQPE